MEASTLVSTKTILLKHYYIRQGLLPKLRYRWHEKLCQILLHNPKSQRIKEARWQKIAWGITYIKLSLWSWVSICGDLLAERRWWLQLSNLKTCECSRWLKVLNRCEKAVISGLALLFFRRRAEHVVRGHGFKHRTQWVVLPSPNSGKRTQSSPLSLLFVCKSELIEFFFCRTHRVCSKLSEFSLLKQY